MAPKNAPRAHTSSTQSQQDTTAAPTTPPSTTTTTTNKNTTTRKTARSAAAAPGASPSKRAKNTKAAATTTDLVDSQNEAPISPPAKRGRRALPETTTDTDGVKGVNGVEQEEKQVASPSKKRKRGVGVGAGAGAGVGAVEGEKEAERGRTADGAVVKKVQVQKKSAEVKEVEEQEGEEDEKVSGRSAKKVRGQAKDASGGSPTTKRKQKKAKDEEEEQQQQQQVESTPSKAQAKAKVKAKAQGKKASKTDLDNVVSDASDAEAATASTPPTTTTTKKPRQPRKTASQKAIDAMPLAPRTPSLPHYLGAHVSAAGGVQNALTNAVHIGANSLALFLKSQRKWDNPALKPEQTSAFVAGCKEHAIASDRHVLPHGSYLVNLATPDATKREQAYASFLDDLRRCETLGIKLYNLHPGNTNGAPRADAIARLAGQLNRAHKDTSTVVTLLENMAASPSANTLGGKFEDLRDVINLVENKDRVGVCLDTCHAFAAGYDLRSAGAFKKTMREFDAIIGAKYLRAVHVNDSKGVLGSHRDLHQNLGEGFLGLRAFWNLMNEKRFEGLPLVLETPCVVSVDDSHDRGEAGTGEKQEKGKGKEKPKTIEDKGVWAREIKLLESLVGMDVEGEEFEKLARGLAEKGEKEREKMQGQFDRKEAKLASPVKGRKAGGKRKMGRVGSDDDDDSDGR